MAKTNVCTILGMFNVKLLSSLPVNQRYKAHHKYEYLYEAESLNAINGASHLRNGPKATCKVHVTVL